MKNQSMALSGCTRNARAGTVQKSRTCSGYHASTIVLALWSRPCWISDAGRLTCPVTCTVRPLRADSTRAPYTVSAVWARYVSK